MKYTSHNHPDRITLQMALANLEGITGYLNEAKRLREQREVVNNLSSAVTRLPFRLSDSRQRLLHRQDVVTRLVSPNDLIGRCWVTCMSHARLNGYIILVYDGKSLTGVFEWSLHSVIVRILYMHIVRNPRLVSSQLIASPLSILVLLLLVSSSTGSHNIFISWNKHNCSNTL